MRKFPFCGGRSVGSVTANEQVFDILYGVPYRVGKSIDLVMASGHACQNVHSVRFPNMANRWVPRRRVKRHVRTHHGIQFSDGDRQVCQHSTVAISMVRLCDGKLTGTSTLPLHTIPCQ